jgi:hypothetical protein
MNHNDPDMNPDSLDEQIRAALRVEGSPQQLARVERFWQRQSRAERRRRQIRRAAALATTVLVAVTASIWLWRQEPAHQPPEVNRPRPIAPNAPDPNRADAPKRTVAVESAGDERSLSTGRPPTTYERFLFVAYTRKSVAGGRPAAVATIDQVIEQLARDPGADAEQLAESSGLMKCDAEPLLLRQLLRCGDEKKHAILQLLVVCGTPRSVPHLLRLSRREAFRDEALATIQRIVGVERLADVVGQTTDRRVRAALYRRLLTANCGPALRAYLSLVHNDATRGEALAVADAAEQPLRDALLALLEDEDKAVRTSAALVLGHVNGPEVTKSLIALVMQKPPNPAEAWIALLACRGERAEEFLAYATRQPQLLGQVNRARMRWARMIP